MTSTGADPTERKGGVAPPGAVNPPQAVEASTPARGHGRSWWHLERWAFFVIDYALAWFAVQLAVRYSPRIIDTMPSGWWEVYLMPLALALGLQLSGVQVNQAGFRGAETLTRIFVGASAGLGSFVLIHALVGYDLVGRYVLGLTLLQTTGLVLVSRWVIWRFAEEESREVFVLGREATFHELARHLAERRLPIRLAGWFDRASARGAEPESPRDLRQLLAACPACEVLVDDPETLTPADRQALLQLMAEGRQISDLAYFFETEFEMVHVDGLRESWFWGYDPSQGRPVYFAAKRLFDVLLSAAGLLLLAPVGVLIGLGIALQDRGPIIYSQIRVGWRNRRFRIYKFRTMRVDAEEAGARWADENDGRVTFFGRLLRRSRLDELPQLWNILRGDMSFIGPRPERPEMMARIAAAVPYYPYRHLIKPGLTGWAQVNYPYGSSIEDARRKLAYDFHYLKYGSVTRELHIALRTAVAMFRGGR